MIVCLRVSAFAATVEERDNPRLSGLPFALMDTGGSAREVAGASQAALRDGVRVGMTLRQAQTFSPGLSAVAANPARARRASDDLMAALAAFSPLVEREVLPLPVSRGKRIQPAWGSLEGDGVWFMNPGRLRREQGLELAATLRDLVLRESQLDPALGLAANRFTARVAAASADLHTITLVPRDSEREFLAGYPAALLPIYPEQARQLKLLGIHTLGDLARLPASALGDLFGKQGAAFKRLAEGRDTTPIRPYAPRHDERAAQQLDDPVEDKNILQNVISALAADLARRLETRGQLAGELTLAVTLAGGGSQLRELALRQPSAAAEHLSRAFGQMLDDLGLGEAVSGVEVTVGAIVQAEARQQSMFPPELVPQDRLRETLRQLIARHGAETFYWADLTNPEARLPERRFALRQAEAA